MTERRDDELEPVLASIARFLEGSGRREPRARGGRGALPHARGRLGRRTKDLRRARRDASPSPRCGRLRLRNAHARAAGRRRGAARLHARARSSARHAPHRAGDAARPRRRGRAALGRRRRGSDAPRARVRASDPGDVGRLEAPRRGAEARRQRTPRRRGATRASRARARRRRAPRRRRTTTPPFCGSSTPRTTREASPRSSRPPRSTSRTRTSSSASRSSTPRRASRAELASLLERRIATVLDPDERVSLEVDRGRALAEVGDLGGAKEAYDAALAVQPDHIGALTAMGELCVAQKDWDGAEQVWVRLARLLATPEEQLAAYRRLGDLYAEHLTNLSRAEVALREVLKRAPDDVRRTRAPRRRLQEAERRAARARDAAGAARPREGSGGEAQAPRSSSRRSTRSRSHDLRKAEQTLEAARREFPSDVGVLRALAEFYIRHKQTPAVNILLDRAAGDTRRAFATGRFSPAALRDDARRSTSCAASRTPPRVVAATLAAVQRAALAAHAAPTGAPSIRASTSCSRPR